MKRLLALLLSLGAAFLLCACTLPFLNQTEPVQQPASDPAQAAPVQIPATPAPTPARQPAEVYAPILEEYVSALSARLGAEDLMKTRVNYMAAYCYGDAPLNQLGYMLYDLDADGVPELFIGSKTGDDYQDKIVLDMYTICNDNPMRVFSSIERGRYYLRSDGLIANENSSSAFDSASICYRYASGDLHMQESVVFDMAADRNSPWFYEVNGTKTQVDEAAAQAKIAEIQSGYVMIDYTPFSQYTR